MNAEPRCLVTINRKERALFFPPGLERPIDSVLPQAKYVETPLPDADWSAQIAAFDPEIIVSCWETPLIPVTANSLRYVCHLCGSVRDQVPRALVERGVAVTNWGDGASASVAEAALFLTLSALRRSHAVARVMHVDRGWTEAKGGTRSLYRRKVGLHGFGAVARRIVALLRPFEVELAAYSEGVPPDCFLQLGVRRCTSLQELFATSEILIEVEALTARTRGCINERLLACLPDEAVFVNVGRGAVVQAGALETWTRDPRKRLALDVYSQEPLPPDSPLRGRSNVELFAHTAGPTVDCYPNCGQLALANLRRYLRGEPLHALITTEVFDRIT